MHNKKFKPFRHIDTLKVPSWHSGAKWMKLLQRTKNIKLLDDALLLDVMWFGVQKSCTFLGLGF